LTGLPDLFGNWMNGIRDMVRRVFEGVAGENTESGNLAKSG